MLRLVTAVLVEQHEEWEDAERRDLSEESMALIDQPEPSEKEDLPLAITACRHLDVELATARAIYISRRDAIVPRGHWTLRPGEGEQRVLPGTAAPPGLQRGAGSDARLLRHLRGANSHDTS